MPTPLMNKTISLGPFSTIKNFHFPNSTIEAHVNIIDGGSIPLPYYESSALRETSYAMYNLMPYYNYTVWFTPQALYDDFQDAVYTNIPHYVTRHIKSLGLRLLKIKNGHTLLHENFNIPWEGVFSTITLLLSLGYSHYFFLPQTTDDASDPLLAFWQDIPYNYTFPLSLTLSSGTYSLLGVGRYYTARIEIAYVDNMLSTERTIALPLQDINYIQLNKGMVIKLFLLRHFMPVYNAPSGGVEYQSIGYQTQTYLYETFNDCLKTAIPSPFKPYIEDFAERYHTKKPWEQN